MTTFAASLIVSLLCLLVLTAAGLFEVAAQRVRANRRVKTLTAANNALRPRVDGLIAANRALNNENTRLHLELTEAQLLAGKNPRALRLVRETSDYDWPALARAIDMEGEK